MNKNKRNKGFSLVELVVVVLIMGIITISLAPQVMKWIGVAQTNTDARIKDNLKSVAQVAVAEYEKGGKDVAAASYVITSAGVNIDGGVDLNPGMKELLVEYLAAEYPQVQNETGKVFQISFSDTGLVTIYTIDGTY